jgi:hypothetical protein
MTEGNLTKLKQELAESFKTYNQLIAQRDQINAEMNNERSKWEAMGMSKKGIKACLSFAKLAEDQRDLFDESYIIAREVLGLSFDAQGDLFEGGDEEEEPAQKPMFDDTEQKAGEAALNAGLAGTLAKH